MTEPAERLPKPTDDSPPKEQKVVDPNDLVYSGGYQGDPREIVENPAVSPQMLNQPGDLRADEMDED